MPHVDGVTLLFTLDKRAVLGLETGGLVWPSGSPSAAAFPLSLPRSLLALSMLPSFADLAFVVWQHGLLRLFRMMPLVLSNFVPLAARQSWFLMRHAVTPGLSCSFHSCPS